MDMFGLRRRRLDGRRSFKRNFRSFWRGICGLRIYMLLLCLPLPNVSAICPNRCICNDETLVVTCNGAHLDVVPITLNPSVRHLILTGNEIGAVIAAFVFYKDLEYIDLSHNRLQAVDTRSFDAQDKLTMLKLSHNLIPQIQNDSFHGLGNLKMLYLNNNNLQEIRGRVFGHLRALEELDLSSNKIAALHPDAFHGLINVRYLILRDNQLTRIPEFAFRPLAPLIHLDMGKNQFEELPPGGFESLTNLAELVLDSCNIHQVDDAAFRGLENLKLLKLQDNLIEAVPSVALSSLVHLEELNMGQNAFREIGPYAFDHLRNLKVIEVSGATLLSAIRRNAFTANVDLETVRVSHNPRLMYIETQAFEGLVHLRHVSMQGNAFRTFSQKLVSWEELESLDLCDNPLECNCSILWLRDLIANRNVSITCNGLAITCTSPLNLQPRALGELGAADLACHFPDVQRQVVIGIIAGGGMLCIALLIFVVIKFRKKMTDAIKDKWSDAGGALRHKDLYYEKTNDQEEDVNNILHIAHQSLKMTPVTEL